MIDPVTSEDVTESDLFSLVQDPSLGDGEPESGNYPNWNRRSSGGHKCIKLSAARTECGAPCFHSLSSWRCSLQGRMKRRRK